MPDPTWPHVDTLTVIEPADGDELTEWFRFVVLIAPRKGGGAYGNSYDTVIAARAWVRDSTTLVRDPSGQQVASSSTVLVPTTVPLPSVGSLVKLPPEFGGRVSDVLTTSANVGGGQPLPEHGKLALT